MSKLEYLNPSDWSLHVIDGKNECVPEEWVLVPEGAEVYFKFDDSDRFLTFRENIAFSFTGFGYMIHDLTKIGIMENKDRILWTRKMKEYLVERDGKYELVEAYHLDGGVEVPEGADVVYMDKISKTFYFYKPEVIRSYLDLIWQRNPSLSNQYEEIEKVRQNSSVSNPKHYTSHPSGIECIEITRHHDFSIGNAIKYLWRAGLKDSDNEIQDLEKAAWYIQDKIKQLKGGK